jgi:hypothetical protein
VTNVETGLELRGIGPQVCEAGAKPLVKREVVRIERALGSTPFRPCGRRGPLDAFRKTGRFSPRTAGERSGVAARNAWASETIRQKIIGHRMAVCGSRLGFGLVRSGLGFRGENRAFALLDQPSSHHGVRIFVQPLVQKRRDLFPQVGGVSEAGELIAVERVSRSGQKKFPGWLGAIAVHGDLRGSKLTVNLLYRTTTTSIITSNVQVLSLWKTVQIKEIPARACSGCAGDYEDPDRTAWEKDFAAEEPDFSEEAEDEPGPDE